MLPSSPFTRAEALDAGVSAYDWRVLVRQQHVRRLVGGVYADARLPDTLDLRIAAVARVLPPDVVVARRTAAWALGVDALDPRGYPTTPPVEVVAPGPALRPRRGKVKAHSADDLRPADVADIGGVRLTTARRTAADLGRFLPRGQALAGIDGLLHAGLVTVAELEDDVFRWRARRGVRQLERLVALADPLRESPGESRMCLRAVDAGFPLPQSQIPIHDLAGRERYRLDLGYLERRLGLEYDGEEHHGPAQAQADARRREWIRGRGWRLAVFRREHIYGPSLEFEHALARLWAG